MEQRKFYKVLSLTSSLFVSTGLSHAAVAVHPVLDLQTGYLLGGAAGGKWRKPADVAKSMGTKTIYRAYRFDRRLADVIGDKPVSVGPPCDETLMSKIRRASTKANRPQFSAGDDAFAIAGPWNALPRVPRVMSTTQPVYRNAVAAILKKHGIERPEVKIKQIWRVDLDGDREPEVLICASRYNGTGGSISPDSRNGDYSLVLLRKMVRGKLKTIVLNEEYHPVGRVFNAPNYFQLAAALDTNGDGKMEIFVRGAYYEGGWVSVFSSNGDKATEVLAAGCGA